MGYCAEGISERPCRKWCCFPRSRTGLHANVRPSPYSSNTYRHIHDNLVIVRKQHGSKVEKVSPAADDRCFDDDNDLRIHIDLDNLDEKITKVPTATHQHFVNSVINSTSSINNIQRDQSVLEKRSRGCRKSTSSRLQWTRTKVNPLRWVSWVRWPSLITNLEQLPMI
ncbi:uncharacterized protein PV06_04998 [Exophiala oligosperma]|uniref:Uncharacterized protein n=1 Tax=Exophiala oligosperma TaxID=215243 RepID=A0A0D2C2I1_9EURO|nr:uncharacterized protein PV06_04998 [Exophiala oligosperma]KIW43952.1 hypothetical protein PV06_04998 [Exophiala oligosperma]